MRSRQGKVEKEEVKSHLKELGIDFTEYAHPAVYTVEEANVYDEGKDFMHCKSLFIKGKKSGKFYLVVMRAEERLDVKSLENRLGEKLTFAGKEDLKNVLDIYPGAVGPFTLLSESASEVIALVEKEVWNADKVGFHPNDNTETLEVKGDGFQKYLKSIKNEVIVL